MNPSILRQAPKAPWWVTSTLFSFRHRRTGQESESHQVDRNRRDFINEMLTRNPTAFAGDVDVQSAMMLFPDRF